MASSIRVSLVAAFAFGLLHCEQTRAPEQSAQALSVGPVEKAKPAPVVAALVVGRA